MRVTFGFGAKVGLIAIVLAGTVSADHYSGAPVAVFEGQRLTVEDFVTCGPDLHPVFGRYEGTERHCREVFEDCASRLHIDGVVGTAFFEGTPEDEAQLARCVWADTDRFRLLFRSTIEADVARIMSGEWSFPSLDAERAEAEMSRLYPAAAEAVSVICSALHDGIERDLCARTEWFGHVRHLILIFPDRMGWER